MHPVHEPEIYVARSEYLASESRMIVTLLKDTRPLIPNDVDAEVALTMHFKPHDNQTILVISFLYM